MLDTDLIRKRAQALDETRSVHTTRTGHGYRHEMTTEDHRRLAEVLHGARGMVVLSGYASPLYDDLYGDWEVRTRKTQADGGAERVEVLWLNPACNAAIEAARAQQRIFA